MREDEALWRTELVWVLEKWEGRTRDETAPGRLTGSRGLVR